MSGFRKGPQFPGFLAAIRPSSGRSPKCATTSPPRSRPDAAEKKMPSLKDLKIRIASVKSTRKITKAMQMVAAAKLRRAQEAAEAARPYAERMEAVLGNLASGASDSPAAPRAARRHRQGGRPPPRRRHLRARPLRRLQLLDRPPRPRAHPTASRRGQDGQDPDRRQEGPRAAPPRLSLLLVGHVDLARGRRLGYTNASAIAQDLLHRFHAGEFDVCTIFFNRFQSVISQIPTARQLIPASSTAAEGAAALSTSTSPTRRRSSPTCCRAASRRMVFTALLENAASEQGARMSAMDNATRNAGDMIDRLTIVYNRSRQAAITKELIEIISGAEAL